MQKERLLDSFLNVFWLFLGKLLNQHPKASSKNYNNMTASKSTDPWNYASLIIYYQARQTDSDEVK